MSESDRIGERLGRVERALSLAVAPVDAYTGSRPLGPLRVELTEAAPGVRSRDGFYLFFGLDAETPAERSVRATGDDRYLPATDAVRLGDLDPSHPVVELPVFPSPAYPFPPWATLVRGRVRVEPDDEDEPPAGTPVAGATVSLSGVSAVGRTDGRGEFAVAIPDVRATEVVMQDGRRLVAPNGDPLSVTATHPETDRSVTLDAVSVPEGGQCSVELLFERT
jgi:hypothetical protein